MIMKIAKRTVLSTIVLAGTLLTHLTTAQAAGVQYPNLKPGYWSLTFYKDTAKGVVNSGLGICVSTDHSWSVGGPIILGSYASGGWSQTGREMSFFGTQEKGNLLGGKVVVKSLSTFGKFITPDLITGEYLTFVPDSPVGSSESGIFEATYGGQFCPL
jgi:hypothetical protein